MELIRLVITGTPGAGKTTFIRTVSDIGIVDTDRTATDATASIKSKTTVAFDFGRVTLGSRMDLHIYGTPGQSRFNFMWDILIRKANAYMLLVAAHRPQDFPQARQILEFMNERMQIPFVIGVTHMDHADAHTPEQILHQLGLGDAHPRPPAIAVDANSKTSVNMSLNVLTLALLMSRNKSNAAARLPKPPSNQTSLKHKTQYTFF